MTRSELKEKIKSLSLEITSLKKTRKSCLYGFVEGLWEAKYEVRHHHVAASLLRGKTLEQIENPSIDNPLNKGYVEKIMNEVMSNEVVCDSKE